MEGQIAADQPQGMQEREAVWILVRLQGRLVHQAAPREVRQQQAVELLLDQVRLLAAQDDPRARRCVFNSSSAVSISQRSWYSAASPLPATASHPARW